MKKFLEIITLLFVFILFNIFLILKDSGHRVIEIVTPTEVIVDFNNDQLADTDEKVCISEVETFTSNLKINQDFLINKTKINKSDALRIGYLSDNFAKKVLLGNKVKIKQTKLKNSKCRQADLYLDNQSYAELLEISGFKINSKKQTYIEKFRKNLEYAKKLNLVIFNKTSNKVHNLDCKYGLNSADYIILSFKDIPNYAQKCKFCFNNSRQKIKKNNLLIHDKTAYKEVFTTDGITLIISDYTNHLIPNNQCEHIICRTIKDLINNTAKTLDIAIYDFDPSPEIISALDTAIKKGVKIRVIHDETPDGKKIIQISEKIDLRNLNYKSDLNLNEKNLTSMLMHNKFIISDSKRVITGSVNFTNRDLSGFNANNILVIESEELAKLYESEFNQMFEGSFHTQKVKNELNNHVKVSASAVSVYFSPQDKTIDTSIIPLINNAKKYIYIPIFVITHKNMCEALINAQKRGVDVRIILDATSIRARHSTHKYLRDNGVKLKTENYAGKMHIKSIIIDDKYVITGSMNFSNSGENKNDENTIIIENTELAKFYRGYFDFLWKKIPDYYLNHSASAESKFSIGSCYDGIDNDYDGKIDQKDDGCK